MIKKKKGTLFDLVVMEIIDEPCHQQAFLDASPPNCFIGDPII